MPRSARRFVALTGVALLLVGCAADRPTLADEVATTTTAPVDAAVPGAERRAAELDGAVDRLVEAGSYRFRADVSLRVGGERTELEITGWVDGDDRELVLRDGDSFSATRVVAGVATVERNGTVTEIPLEAAATAPSLDILTRIRNVTYAPGNTLRGSLSAQALAEVGFEVDGSAQVSAVVVNGELLEYTITATNDAWSITSVFSEVGAVQR